MKIKSINPQVKGIQLQVPIDGLISIDANGYAVVSDKCAELLINGTSDWESADGKKADAEDAEEQDFISKVKSMSLDEMVQLCEELGFPKEEYQKLLNKKASEKLLAGYLIKKYSELEAAAEDEDNEDETEAEDNNEGEAHDDAAEETEEETDDAESKDAEDAGNEAEDAEEQAEDKSKGKAKKNAAKGKK